MEVSIAASSAMLDNSTRDSGDNSNLAIVPLPQDDIAFLNSGGYSLIELITIIVLIGISFPGLIGFLANSMEDSAKIDIINKGIFLAREKMEIISSDKNEPTRGVSYITAVDQYPTETINGFTINVSLKRRVVGSVSGLEVTVTVSHQLLTNEYTLTQFFTEYHAY